MIRNKGKNDRNTCTTGSSLYDMRYTIIPYCDTIKGITQRSTGSPCIRCTSSVVANTIGIIQPIELLTTIVYNRWVNIVHNDRLRGYVLRSWSSIEEVEAVSRRVFNPGSGEIISITLLGTE